MTIYSSRSYRGAGDLGCLVKFAGQRTVECLPGLSYYHPGDVSWQLYLATAEMDYEDIRLWFDGGHLVAFAIFEPPLHSGFDLSNEAADDGTLFDEVLDWIESRRRAVFKPDETVPIAYGSLGTSTVSTNCLESDHRRIAALQRRGYVPTTLHDVRYQRSLAGEIATPQLPRGYRVRHAVESDIEVRAELHREAWNVWGPSKFSPNRYRRLRAAPGYREEFDIVVESGDGQLVSYCLGWVDEPSGIGLFEPVGTRAAFTGRGLGRAAIHEGLRRMRKSGIHTARIGTSSVNGPALRLYPACGFTFVERADAWAKAVL